MAEPDPTIWKRMEKNGFVYYRAFNDNGIPYYWSGKKGNAAQWEKPIAKQVISKRVKKADIIGREPKPEYREEYDELLKLSLPELQKKFRKYKDNAEEKLKVVVTIIRPKLKKIGQGLTDDEKKFLAAIPDEEERGQQSIIMTTQRLKDLQAQARRGPEETAKLQQIVDLYENWNTLTPPKNEDEDIYKENIAKVIVGLLRNYIDYIPIEPKVEDVEPAIRDAELVSEFFYLFPPDVRTTLQKVRGGVVILNKKMGRVESVREFKPVIKKQFVPPVSKQTRKQEAQLEKNRKIFKEQENLEQNLGKRPRLRGKTKRLFPMSAPPPLKNHPALKEGTLRARGKVAVRRRGTVRERKPLASWHPRIRIPSNAKGGPGAPKASLRTPRLQALSPLVEQLRVRAPTHARRGPGAPKASATHSTPRLQGRSPLVEQMRIRAPTHTRRGPGAPKASATHSTPRLQVHSPLVEETAKKIVNLTRRLQSKGKKLQPKEKESLLKRLLSAALVLTHPLYANAPQMQRKSVNVPFKGALVRVGPERRGPGPGAKPPGHSKGPAGNNIDPMAGVNFECPADSEPGADGFCMPKPKPEPKPEPTPKPTPKPTPTPKPPTKVLPGALPKGEQSVLKKGCPQKLPLYEATLTVTVDNEQHQIEGKLCASGIHFIPSNVLEVGGLNEKAGDYVGEALHVDHENEHNCLNEVIYKTSIEAAEKAAAECKVFPKWKGEKTEWRGEPAYKAAKEVVEHPERFDLTASDVARFKDHFKGNFPAE